MATDQELIWPETRAAGGGRKKGERASPSTAEILAGLSPGQAAGLAEQVRDRLMAYASPGGVVMPGAAWLVTAQAG